MSTTTTTTTTTTEDQLKEKLLEKQRELANSYKDKDILNTEIKRVSKLCLNSLHFLSKDPFFSCLKINELPVKHRCDELRLLLSTFQKCVDENKKVDDELYAHVSNSEWPRCVYKLNN